MAPMAGPSWGTAGRRRPPRPPRDGGPQSRVDPSSYAMLPLSKSSVISRGQPGHQESGRNRLWKPGGLLPERPWRLDGTTEVEDAYRPQGRAGPEAGGTAP